MAQPKTHVLAVSDEDLAVVAAGLNELPRKLSEPVLQRLQRQLDEELAEDEKVSAARAEKKGEPPTTAS